MRKTFAILKPLLIIALILGALRFAVSAVNAPRGLVYLFSLTAVEIVGMFYMALRIGRERELKYLHLWAANLILFGLCQLLTIGGLAYTYISGRPTLYHETERLRNFLGYDPTPLQHIGMHVLNWMIVGPTIATWIIGAPIVYFARWRSRKAVARS